MIAYGRCLVGLGRYFFDKERFRWGIDFIDYEGRDRVG